MKILLKTKEVWLLFSIFCLISCFAYLLFAYPALYDPDSYYNIAISNLIKDFGFRYEFKWANFSILNSSFSDRDLLLHIIILPFLYITSDPVLAGKFAIILLIALFFLAYTSILKKYLPDILVFAFLLLPITSPAFSAYLLQLRSVTLSNILTMLGIYFLLNKKFFYVFVLSFIYPLTHLSFFMLIIFALVCETLRYVFNKQFCKKNILLVILGMAAGCAVHPNFPNNLLAAYLNGILVPMHLIGGINLNFSGELAALDTGIALINNITLFFAFNLIMWSSFLTKKRAGFATAVWLVSSGIYMLLAFFAARYWYQANLFVFIALASWVNDIAEGRISKRIASRILILIMLYFVVVSPLVIRNFNQLIEFINFSGKNNLRIEKAAQWMNMNIPKGRTIYHSYYDDSSYFICLNPKDSYINTNDPIYMQYRYPREFAMMNDLSMGRVSSPQDIFEKMFRADYGYVRKIEPLFRQIKSDPNHFRIVYEDGESIIFELIKN